MGAVILPEGATVQFMGSACSFLPASNSAALLSTLNNLNSVTGLAFLCVQVLLSAAEKACFHC